MLTLRRIAGVLAGAFFALAASQALAQGTIQQSGPAIPGNPSVFTSNGVVQSAGPASGGGPNAGIGELLGQAKGVGSPPFANSGSGPLGTNFCDNDGPVTNSSPYHYLCLSPNAAGGGLIVYGAGNGAPQLPFQIIVNGQPWTPGVPTANFRLITSGTTGTAISTDGTIGWKSATSGAKTMTLYLCDASAKGNELTIADDLGTASSLTPINITPIGGNTIGVFYTVYAMNFGGGSQSLVCDGLSNWILK